jgi:hypothetical protein
MASVELSVEQVLDLVRQLPAACKREVLIALATEPQSTQAERMTFAESQFRRLARERGLDWQTMSDDERQDLADSLIHEGRPCLE